MRINLSENKITLIKIKNIIYPEKDDIEFLNKIFSPFAKEKMSFYESYSIEKHKSFFMNGNITKNYNKSSGNYNMKQRDRIHDLKDWAKMLICGTAFSKMLDIIKGITENSVFNRNHRIFNLIEIDKDIMPDNFLNFINLCLEENECAKALLMLILWSIYGECIIYIEDIYAVSKKSLYNSFQKNVRLVSHTKSCRPVFMGRDAVIDDIHKHFISGNHFIFLKGMGGIGKSECAKQYAEKYKSDYNTIVFAECTDSLINLINDNSVFTLTVPFVSERMPNESDEEFFCRKIAQIKKIADERTLVIIDNLDFISTAEIERLIAVPFRLIVTTRCDYSSIYHQQTKFIEEITDKIIIRSIFTAYYGKNVDDFSDIDKIIDMFSGHTMAIELIAKQMKSACMMPDEMLYILQKSAESELEEKFIMPNHSKEYQTLPQHMLTLFNVSALNDEEKYILMCLSLMPLSSIEKRSFKQACGFKNFNSINKLIERSWIVESCGKIYLHTLIKETVKIFCRPDLFKCHDFINGLITEFPAIRIYHGNNSDKNEIFKIISYIYEKFPAPSLELCDFYEWLELVFSHCIRYDISLQIAEKLHEIYLSEYGENHFRTARMLVRKAYALNKYNNSYDIEHTISVIKKCRNIIINLKNRTEKETLYISDIDCLITNMIMENFEFTDISDSLDKIEELCFEIISIRKNFKEKTDPLYLHLVSAYRNLALIEFYRHNYDKVEYWLELAEKECIEKNTDYNYFLKEYIQAKIALKKQKFQKAIYYMKSSIKRYNKYFKECSVKSIHMKTELGDIYRKLGYKNEAYNIYKDALKCLEGLSYKNNELYQEIYDKIQSVENE